MQRDAFGKLVVEFQKLNREGTWHTAIRIGGEYLAMAPYIGEFMTNVGIVNKARSAEEIGKLTDIEKRNLAKVCMDVVAFVMGTIIVMGLKGMGDEDKRAKAAANRKYGRIIRAFKNGLDTSIIAAPGQVIDLVTSIALLQNARRMIDLLTLSAPLSDITFVAPFGGTSRVA